MADHMNQLLDSWSHGGSAPLAVGGAGTRAGAPAAAAGAGGVARGELVTSSGRSFRRCAGCGAWGEGAVSAATGLCGHCERGGAGGGGSTAAGHKRSREAFESAAAASGPVDDGDDDGSYGDGAGAGAGAGSRRGVGGELSEAEIAAMLAAAEGNDAVASLDSLGVKKLLLSLEKKVTRNSLARAKFSDQPARFLDSEVELDEELKGLRVLAAAPEQYPVLSSSDSLRTLLSLLSHDNADIASGVVALLGELVDEDAIGSREEATAPLPEEPESDDDDEDAGDLRAAVATARRRRDVFAAGVGLIDAIRAAGGLELIISHLARVDGGASEEDSQGVYAVLTLLAAMVEAQPALASALCELGTAPKPGASSSSRAPPPPPLLALLLRRVRAKAYDANKLAASELLSIVTVADTAAVCERLGSTLFHLPSAGGASSSAAGHAVDGVEYLLEALAVYKKRDPASGEEAEAAGNLVSALCSCLLLPANRDRFRAAEGFELMLRVVHETGWLRLGALKILSYAVTASAANAAALVAAGGLKAVFPAFAGKGAAHTRKTHGADAVTEEEEHAASIVAALLALLPPASPGPAGVPRLRLLGKFREDGHEKVGRAVELLVAAGDRVVRAAAEDDEDSDDEDGDDEGARAVRGELRYLRRLDGGLAVQQRLAAIVVALAVDAAGGVAAPAAIAASAADAAPIASAAVDPGASALALELALAARGKLYEQGGSLVGLVEVLEEQRDRLAAAASDAGGGSAATGAARAAAVDRAYLDALLPAAAAAAGLDAGSDSGAGGKAAS